MEALISPAMIRQKRQFSISAFDLNDHRPRETLQIAAETLQAQPRPCCDERPYFVFLPESELHHQPSARPQFRQGSLEHSFDIAQAAVAAKQRNVRLVADSPTERQPVDVAHVRRVRRDQIEVARDTSEVS